MTLIASLALALALAQSAPTAAAAAAAPQDLARVIRDYEAFRRTDDPLEAAADGDVAARSRMPDPSLAADMRRRTALEGFLQRLRAIPAEALPEDGRLDKALLEHEARIGLDDLKLDMSRINFDAYSGFHLTASEMALRTVIHNAAEAEDYLTRIAALPAYLDAQILNDRRGIATRFTQPRPTVEVVIEIVRRQTERPASEDPLLEPFDRIGADLPAAQKSAYRARALQLVVERVKPAQAKLLTFLRTEYLPAARQSLAARDLPDGEAVYRHEIALMTTTAMGPDEIHALGLQEVARIRAEMEALIRSTGFAGDFKAFQAFLRHDPQFYVATREALLDRAARFNKRVDDALPREFGRLPRLPFAVREIPRENEESATTAYYEPGAPAVGRAGGFMVNTSHLDQRPLYELPALALHESAPGHHLQIALQQELPAVSAFRRHLEYNAFQEGWALYAEQLGDEMGVYTTPYERFGHLSYDMWRACRLVADTGLHWLRWSREQARACFADNSALAPKNIEVELDRYISWPAQALGYKIGELQILKIRAKAEGALKDRFDVRRFHDAILSQGPLPLDLLAERMDRWIAAEAGRT